MAGAERRSLVTREPSRVSREDLALAFARYREIAGDWPAFLDALSRPLPRCLQVHRLRITAEALAAECELAGVHVSPLGWHANAMRVEDPHAPLGRLWPLLAGLCQVQEEVAMMPAVLLDARPGERILDLCASPGNKTAQIALAMENRGTVVANDNRASRTRALRNTIERLGLLNVATTVHDGTAYPTAAGEFDRVLVDAPCSGEGMSRKRMAVLGGLLEARARGYVPVQSGLLARAVRLCRTGGRIVYSTCTYAPEENELVVDAILRQIGDDVIRLLPARIEGVVSSPGLTAWQGHTLHPDLARSMRLWPHQNDCGGHFIAVFEKLREERNIGPTRRPRRVEPAAPEPQDEELDAVIRYFADRFGLPRERLDRLGYHRTRKRGYYVLSPDHRPPISPEPDTSGVFAFRTGLVYPKPSTALALAFGAEATRNTLELDAKQLELFVSRRECELRAEQTQGVTSRGYVIARRRGRPLGIGFFDDRQIGEEGDATNELQRAGRLRSYYPKGWA